MPPIKINVTGSSTIARKPERAVVVVCISSSGPDQAKVNQNVTSTITKVQHGLKQLALKDNKTGEPLPDAAITHWSMSSLSTGSYFIWLPHKAAHSSTNSQTSSSGDATTETHKVPNFTASTTVEIKFRDFAKLGSVCADLANVRHVQVRSVAWRLTDATRDAVRRETRGLAVRDAMAQAHDFATAAGKSRVWAVEIDADASAGGPLAVGFGAMSRSRAQRTVSFAGDAAEGEAVNFQPEDVEVQCTVRVRCEAE